ncbi:MAG: DUF924 family protein [Pseudomonadota bacterium]
MSDDRAAAILSYWLEELGPKLWYARPDPARDAEIAARFGADLEAAAAGRCRGWLARPDYALALMILLDQFPRHIHRGRAEAFATDALALAAAGQAIAQGHDVKIAEPERQFFYLPFMHSERLADQERCVRLVLLNLTETGAQTLIHSAKHREVIRRFGRFPSRNAALGRADTERERAYRAERGYMS